MYAEFSGRVTTITIVDASHALFPEHTEAVATAILYWIGSLPP